MFLLYPGGGWVGILVLIGTALFSWFFLRKFLIRSWTTHYDSEELLNLPEARALEILKERYAKGEITRDEYLSMKKDLED